MDNILTINYILLILVIILGAGLAQVWWHYNRATQIRHPITTIIQILGITFVIAMLALVVVSIMIGENIVLSTYLLQDLILSFFIAIAVYFLIIKPSNIEIKEQMKRVNSIIDHALNGILVVNDAGIIELFNPSASNILGYASHEVIGRKFTILVPEPYKTEYMEYLRRYLETGIGEVIDSGPREVVGLKEDGTTIPIELLISSMKLDSKRLFLVVFQDIKHRKEVEEAIKKAHDMAVEASVAKSEFLSNMSHEIRTPMNTIIGISDLLSETPLNDEQKKYVQIFKESGEHLLSLINDILDISKIEAGHAELEHADFNLQQIMDKIKEMMLIKIDPQKLNLIFDTEPDIPRNLIGDAGRLKQVLLNLIGNAIKFTDKGEVLVKTKLKSLNMSKKEVELLFEIHDTGIGISAEKVGLLFHDFTQGDLSFTRKYGGSGLGLAISKKLIELMNGNIWVESEVGKGSTFYFTAKFLTATPKQIENRLSDEKNITIPASTVSDENKIQEGIVKRILLVDDSDDNRQLIELYLKKLPYTIDIAQNGEVAVDKFKTNKYDIVLMDIQMPVMDGYMATKIIRKWESDKQLTPTPIIALTAHAFKEDEQKSLDAGCTGHLSKPIHKTTLLEALDKYILH
jgi:PAS domain S-box-containing protein